MAPSTSHQQGDVDELWNQLRQKDAQILVLQKKLGHFRSWISTIHARVQLMSPQALKNCKRLYIGNLPDGCSEVRSVSSVQHASSL